MAIWSPVFVCVWNSQLTGYWVWMGIVGILNKIVLVMVVCDLVHACIGTSQETEVRLWLIMVVCDWGRMWKAWRGSGGGSGESIRRQEMRALWKELNPFPLGNISEPFHLFFFPTTSLFQPLLDKGKKTLIHYKDHLSLVPSNLRDSQFCFLRHIVSVSFTSLCIVLSVFTVLC